jgi:hypothetical protein
MSRSFVLSALASLALASAGAANAQPLDNALCQAVAGTPANYNPNFAPAPGSPRPLRVFTLPPPAVCNDGSPAVMYVRPAPQNSPNQDDWIVLFDGGGGCGTPDECLARWCSLGASPAIFDRAGKMSSLGLPPTMDPPGGILSRNPINRFAGWNHVFVNYCTSDDHLGGAGPKKVSTGTPAAAWTFDIQFQGEAVVNEVIAQLRSGPTIPNGFGPAQAVPDIDNAEKVLIAHESAGDGMRMHVDRIAAQLTPQGIDVRDVSDAGFGSGYSDPGLSWALAPYADYDEFGALYMLPKFQDFWEVQDSALDASCLASGVADWYCYDNHYVLLNEMTTPAFVRADLSDMLARKRPLDWGMFATLYDYVGYVADQFALLPPGSGYLGVNCGGHVALQTRGFWRTEVANGSTLTWNDLLANWVWGAGGLVTTDVQRDADGVAPYDRSLLCN